MEERTPDMEGDIASLQAQMRNLLTGYRITRLIVVAVQLGIADALAQGPRGVEELALSIGAHAPSLYRVLRALSSLGIFRELDNRRFELTPKAQLLRADVRGSIRHAALTLGESWWWDAWGRMADAVRTGETAFEQTHGMGLFEFMTRRPELARRFDSHMVAMTDMEARQLVEGCELSTARRVVDVGGGHGALLQAILAAHPHVYGILYDLPATVAGAKQRFEEAGYLDRSELVAGDFFEGVPAGADTYVLKNVLHDWNDERVGLLLRNCRRAIPQGGRLLIIEHIVAEANEPSPAKMADMTMLVIVGGAERTAGEYRRLLRDCEFDVTRIIRVASGFDIIEAMPA